MVAKFGPAGSSLSFTAAKKKTVEMPEYLHGFGLQAYEYQFGRGVRGKAESFAEFGKNAGKYGITVSAHAPYYISLSSANEETRLKSVEYILQTAEALKHLGGRRMVVHAGSLSGRSRKDALVLAKNTLKLALDALDENRLDMTVCPETMGKINQLGDLDEVLELCLSDERMIPCIDFGHLNARTMGGIKTKEDYLAVFDKIENVLGHEKLEQMHCHFSKIEYSAGGEKRHLNLDDKKFGPPHEIFAGLIAQKKLSPIIISESAGLQAEDAALMQKIYKKVMQEYKK